jgi:hypothetical protein
MGYDIHIMSKREGMMQDSPDSPGTRIVLEILRTAAPETLTLRQIQKIDRRGVGLIALHREVQQLAEQGLVIKLGARSWRAWEVKSQEDEEETDKQRVRRLRREAARARREERARFRALILEAIAQAPSAPTTGRLMQACGWPEGRHLDRFHKSLIALIDEGEIFVEHETGGIRHWADKRNKSWPQAGKTRKGWA